MADLEHPTETPNARTSGRMRVAAGFAAGSIIAVALTITTMQAWNVGAAPGDSDATWVPITPCRLFDYRAAPNTVGPRSAPLQAGQPYEQPVTGINGNCTIPTSAVAVSLNVTAVNPTAQSNLRIYPANIATVPVVSNLNFSAGQKPVANKVDVKLSPSGRIKLLNFQGSVSVVGDIVGYYTNTTLDEIDNRLLALELAPIVITSANDWVRNDGVGGPIVERFLTATRFTGDGVAQLGLEGPASIAGRPRELASVTTCVVVTGPIYIDVVRVFGRTTESTLLEDLDDITGSGCYTFATTVGPTPEAGYELVLTIAGIGTIYSTTTTSTWTT